MATLAGATRTNLRWIEATMSAAAIAGADVVGIADSMGGALPETIEFLMHLSGTRPVRAKLSFHGHNTFGLATANTLAAIRAGATVVDAVPLGLGKGAGIAPLEEIAFALEVLYGVDTGLKMERVAQLCREVQCAFKVEYPPTKTFIGSGIYRHSIDSHIASILRGKWHSWECVQPSVVGQKRQLEFGFAKIRRGRSGAIAAKIEKMGLAADDQQLDRIIDEVQAITRERDWASELDVEQVITRAS